jgi:hypothetical protein
MGRQYKVSMNLKHRICLMPIPQEEARCIVTDPVPVSMFLVKLDREAADVPLGVRRAALADYGREAHE